MQVGCGFTIDVSLFQFLKFVSLNWVFSPCYGLFCLVLAMESRGFLNTCLSPFPRLLVPSRTSLFHYTDLISGHGSLSPTLSRLSATLLHAWQAPKRVCITSHLICVPTRPRLGLRSHNEVAIARQVQGILAASSASMAVNLALYDAFAPSIS